MGDATPRRPWGRELYLRGPSLFMQQQSRRSRNTQDASDWGYARIRNTLVRGEHTWIMRHIHANNASILAGWVGL
jgi:hypothetical protein